MHGIIIAYSLMSFRLLRFGTAFFLRMELTASLTPTTDRSMLNWRRKMLSDVYSLTIWEVTTFS